MSAERFAAVRAKTEEVLAKAKQLYGVDVKPTISFNLRGRVAGWATCKFCAGQRVYGLKFNRDLIAGKHYQDILDETISHEVAHIVNYVRPDTGRKHDAGWRRVCIALGGNGNTRHDYDVTYANGSWDYVSNTGHVITVSQQRHAKIQKGTGYAFRYGKGRIDRYSRFARTGQPMPADPPNGNRVAEISIDDIIRRMRAQAAQPAAAPAKPVQQAVVQPSTEDGSWADRMRALIRTARARGDGKAVVVQQAIAMGMKLSSARNCVQANWDRA